MRGPKPGCKLEGKTTDDRGGTDLQNVKRTRFIEEYLSAPGDPAGAAIRAGYSPARARRQARALLTDPAMRAQIERRQAGALLGDAAAQTETGRRRARTEAPVSPERVIRELARIAFADPAEMLCGGAYGDALYGAEEPPASCHPERRRAAPEPKDLSTPLRAGQDAGREAPAGEARFGRDSAAPAGLVPGSGTGLKLKYTPKRAPDGGTVFELSMEREVRVGDKLRALEMLSKYLGVAVPPAPPDPDAGEESGGIIVLPEVEE